MEDAWTTVPRKGKRGKERSLPQGTSINVPNPPDEQMTLEQLQRQFAVATKRWEQSTSCATLYRTLDAQHEHGDWGLTKAVCIATGSFSRDNATNNRRAMQQFAAFVSIARHLQARADGVELRMFAQEPYYTTLDKRLMEHLGITYVHVEAGWTGLGKELESLIDSSTFVFEPFMEQRMRALRELYSRAPRLYIGSSMSKLAVGSLLQTDQEIHEELDGEEDKIAPLRERNTAAGAFVQSRKPGKYWPRFEEDPQVFEGMMVYWEQDTDG